MNPFAITKAKQAFTFIELLVVIAILGILSAMLLPVLTDRGCTPPQSTICMSNLRQVGLGLILYAQDNKDMFPWQVSTNHGGTAELAQDGNAADHFVKLASYFPSPRIFLCPTDKERQVGTTNYFGFSNTNLSYFAAPTASLTLTSSPVVMILSGDRHLAFNEQPVKPGLFSVTNPAAMSWTKELHHLKNAAQTLGVLVFADGHAEVVMTPRLAEKFQAQAIATNRLAIP